MSAANCDTHLCCAFSAQSAHTHNPARPAFRRIPERLTTHAGWVAVHMSFAVKYARRQCAARRKELARIGFL
jgi:uncharacterized membrane protein